MAPCGPYQLGLTYLSIYLSICLSISFANTVDVFPLPSKLFKVADAPPNRPYFRLVVRTIGSTRHQPRCNHGLGHSRGLSLRMEAPFFCLDATTDKGFLDMQRMASVRSDGRRIKRNPASSADACAPPRLFLSVTLGGHTSGFSRRACRHPKEH